MCPLLISGTSHAAEIPPAVGRAAVIVSEGLRYNAPRVVLEETVPQDAPLLRRLLPDHEDINGRIKIDGLEYLVYAGEGSSVGRGPADEAIGDEYDGPSNAPHLDSTPTTDASWLG